MVMHTLLRYLRKESKYTFDSFKKSASRHNSFTFGESKHSYPQVRVYPVSTISWCNPHNVIGRFPFFVLVGKNIHSQFFC